MALANPFEGALPVGWDLRGCALTELADGDLLAVVVAIDKTIRRPTYNPDTEGLVPVRNLVARSDDGGATWSEPWELADGRHVQLASQGLLTLPDGGAAVHIRDVQDLRRPGETWRYTGGVLRSEDSGRDLGPAGHRRRVRSGRRSARHDVVGPAHRPGPRVRQPGPVLLRLPPRDPGRKARSTSRGAHDDGATVERARLDRAAGAGDLSPATPRRSVDGLPATPGRRRRRWSRSCRTMAAGPSIAAASAWSTPHVDASAPGADGSLSAFDYLMSMDRFTLRPPMRRRHRPERGAVPSGTPAARRGRAIRSARLRID